MLPIQWRDPLSGHCACNSAEALRAELGNAIDT
jgi:hypothetical protein